MEYLNNFFILIIGFVSGLGLAYYRNHHDDIKIDLSTIKSDLVSLHIKLENLIQSKILK